MKFQMHANLTKIANTNDKNKVTDEIKFITKDVFDIHQDEKDICGPTLLIDSNTIYEGNTLGLTLKFYFPSFSEEYIILIKKCFIYMISLTTNRKSFSFDIEKNLDIKNSKILNNKRFRTSIGSVNIHYDLANDNEHIDTFFIQELIDYIDEV